MEMTRASARAKVRDMGQGNGSRAKASDCDKFSYIINEGPSRVSGTKRVKAN